MGFNGGVAAEEHETAKLFIMARRGAVGEVGVAGGLAGAWSIEMTLQLLAQLSFECDDSIVLL